MDQPAMIPRLCAAISGRAFRALIVSPYDNLSPPQQILKCRQPDRYGQYLKRGNLPAN
jgi:hypothetical protein